MVASATGAPEHQRGVGLDTYLLRAYMWELETFVERWLSVQIVGFHTLIVRRSRVPLNMSICQRRVIPSQLIGQQSSQVTGCKRFACQRDSRIPFICVGAILAAAVLEDDV